MIYILDINDFVGKSDITSYIETDRLTQYLGIVQEKSCLEVLCRRTYNELISQLESGGEGGLDANYTSLLPYVKNFLIYRTVERYVINADFISTNAGFRKHTDEVSEGLTNAEKDILIKQAQSDSTFYKNELINFLDDNKDNFPLWAESQCSCTKFHPVQNIRFSKNLKNKKKINWT